MVRDFVVSLTWPNECVSFKVVRDGPENQILFTKVIGTLFYNGAPLENISTLFSYQINGHLQRKTFEADLELTCKEINDKLEQYNFETHTHKLKKNLLEK